MVSLLQLFREAIDPEITRVLENYDTISEALLAFQQDGAPLHYALDVSRVLKESFPARWIGRRGQMME